VGVPLNVMQDQPDIIPYGDLSCYRESPLFGQYHIILTTVST